MVGSVPEFSVGSVVLLETPAARTRARVHSGHGDLLALTDLSERFRASVPAGTVVQLLHVTQGGVYAMQATITEIDDATARLRIDTAVDRIQRRRYVRVDRPLPAHVLLLDEATGRFREIEAQVTDVSGGGLAMRAGAIAPQGAVVVAALTIPDERPVVAVGAALANDREDRARLGADGAKLRIQFTHLTEADRDRLIRHILRTAVVQPT